MIRRFLALVAVACMLAQPANAAAIVMIGAVQAPSGQIVDQVPTQIVNPNNGTPCFVGNTGCPSIGGGGGSGGAVTVADGADIAEGATTQTTPCAAPTTSGCSVAQVLRGILAAGQDTTPVAVTGPLTDTQLRATAVPVSGPLTDTQLRATAVPVSGTVTANLGTLNGAATAAKQSAPGTAGSPSTDVLSVQGVASGTPLAVGGSAAGGAATSGNPIKFGCVYNTTPPTYTNGQQTECQGDTRGNTYVNLAATGFSGSDGLSNSMVAVSTSTTLGNQRTLAIAGWVYNGTTWDRLRSITGSFGSAVGVQAVETAGDPSVNIATATTTAAIKSGAGILHKIAVNTPVASEVITVYDSLTATGTKLATITLPSTITSDNPFVLTYDIAFATGLTIVTSSTADITVTYR